MPREAVPMYGRSQAVGLVQECLIRPEDNGALRSRRTPVLIFTGSRGSGKTLLLAELARRLDQQTPLARVDFQTADPNDARNVLTALVFEFNRKCGRYGALGFPRFIIAKLAIEQTLRLSDRKASRAKVEQAVEKNRKIDQLREFLKDTAPAVLSSIPGAAGTPGVNGVGRYLPDLALDGLVSWRRGRRVVLGDGLDWFGHQDRKLSLDPLDVLVDLNRKANAKNDTDSQREATELLWAAFLADLCHGFRHGRRAGERSFNCVILLDNVDTPEGLTFLEELVAARRKRMAYKPQEADPLTVVATSRGTLVERVTEFGDSTGDDDWLNRWWYTATLDDLSDDEVANMVAAVELHRGSRRRVTAMVHQLTAGHPGSTNLLLEAVAEKQVDRLDLRAVLDAQEPGLKPEMTVGERLLRRFQFAIPDGAVNDLVTCAAARDINEAMRLVTHSRLVSAASAVFVPELWTAGGPAEAKAMQPPLRRLLLRKLAGRTNPDEVTWSAVHGWFIEDRARNEDETGRLYHMLAIGDVEQVAKQLATMLPSVDAAGWLELLDRVVCAPNQADHDGTPIEELTRLTEWCDPQDIPLATVARLVTGLWLVNDPLIDSRRRSLHLELAADYDHIAPYPTHGLERLRARAERHRAEAARWD